MPRSPHAATGPREAQWANRSPSERRYGHAGYGWHEIGVSVYEVASKTYDSECVIGRACPHGSFANPAAALDAAPWRSIELRVLCYVRAR